MIATFQRNISQHCWLSIYKPQPNNHNILRQHIATLLCTAFCMFLATLLRCVATCWVLQIELVCMPWRNIVAQTWPNKSNIMQHPQMLHGKFDHFQTWTNNTQHVATRPNRVAKHAQHVAPNSVAICCVEMLQSFGRGLRDVLKDQLCLCYLHVGWHRLCNDLSITTCIAQVYTCCCAFAYLAHAHVNVLFQKISTLATEGLFVWAPGHPFGNSSLPSYFLLIFSAFETPTPFEFLMIFYGLG